MKDENAKDLISLNDIVEMGFGDFRDRPNIDIEFNIDDEMPKAYAPDSGYVLYSVEEAIKTQLRQEYETYAKGKIRITTKLEGEYQILELDHCGEHIPTYKIQFLNETLQRIAEGQELDCDRFRPSGNNMAARGLQEGKGIMQYENINDGQYRVRCVVRIPLEAQS